MNPLPPLRTVRPAVQPTTSGEHASTPTPMPVSRAQNFPSREIELPNIPGLPGIVREFVGELVGLSIVTESAVRELLPKLAGKFPMLTTREHVATAFVNAGLLTAYQRDRILGGSPFGLSIGPYRVIDRLGGGTVGLMFLAEHATLGRRAAVKVLPNDSSVPTDIIARFHAEAKILASLDHPHIVTAFDAGFVRSPAPGEPSLHYLALEFVSGGDLEQYVCKRGPQPIPRACEWARQLASGLQAAHDRQLVHRDLKPSNVLLTDDRRVKITDFGLARQHGSALTRPGTLVGSVEFMAPEQAGNASAVGPAADVYGLGATLFWVLTGQLPIPKQRTLAETARAVATATPRRLRELLPDAPDELDGLVDRMLARNPADRPTALEAMLALIPFTLETGDSEVEVTRLHEVVRQHEASLRAKDDAVAKLQEVVLFTLAKTARIEPDRAARLREYTRLLVEQLQRQPAWAMLADPAHAADLLRCVPLHDLGASGLELLDVLARERGELLPFLGILRGIVRHHRTRWDGTTQADGPKGNAIPPPARIAAAAVAYDEVRRANHGRPELAHAQATLALCGTTGRFDPAVLVAFQATAKQFDQVWATTAE